jgi:hypothetical protein
MADFERNTGEFYGGEGGQLSVLQRTPFVRELMRGQPGKLPQYTADLLPAASSAQRGALALLIEDGVVDKVVCCRKAADGTYAWVVVTTS